MSSNENSKSSINIQENQQRELKTLDPETLYKIINNNPTKNTLVHYTNPHYGTFNKRPCIRSRCDICPLSTVDYKPSKGRVPSKTKGPRKNVSQRQPKANPKSLCAKCTRKYKASKASASKRIKKSMEDRKRKLSENKNNEN